MVTLFNSSVLLQLSSRHKKTWEINEIENTHISTSTSTPKEYMTWNSRSSFHPYNYSILSSITKCFSQSQSWKGETTMNPVVKTVSRNSSLFLAPGGGMHIQYHVIHVSCLVYQNLPSICFVCHTIINTYDSLASSSANVIWNFQNSTYQPNKHTMKKNDADDIISQPTTPRILIGSTI